MHNTILKIDSPRIFFRAHVGAYVCGCLRANIQDLYVYELMRNGNLTIQQVL